MKKNNLSFSFRLLRFIGMNIPEEEYGNVSLYQIFIKGIISCRNTFLLKHFMNFSFLAPFNPRIIRPWVLRKIGCHVGKDVFIGSDIWVDSGHADLVFIDDHAHVTGRTVLLCSTGTGTIIMPGVTIGEGAIVGAGSLVTKDIPAWTIAVGRPAKVVRQIPSREEKTDKYE